MPSGEEIQAALRTFVKRWGGAGDRPYQPFGDGPHQETLAMGEGSP